MADRDGVIVFWSQGAQTLFGWPVSEATGQRLDIVIPPRFRDAHWAGFRRAMDAPEMKDMAADLPVLCADGVERHFAGRLLALPDALGQAAGAIAIYTDAGSTSIRPFG